jgi:hypothetical protein
MYRTIKARQLVDKALADVQEEIIQMNLGKPAPRLVITDHGHGHISAGYVQDPWEDPRKKGVDKGLGNRIKSFFRRENEKNL